MNKFKTRLGTGAIRRKPVTVDGKAPRIAAPSYSRDRAIYDIMNAAKQKGQILSPSYLRLERDINQATSDIQFQTSSNQNQNTNEIRLNPNDAFTITSIAFFLYKAAVTSPAVTPTDLQRAQAALLSFPDPKVWTAPVAANLHVIYNGQLNLTIGKTVTLSSYPMLDFYRVGQAQDTFAAYSGGPAQVAEWDNKGWGRANIDPIITLNGADDNTFQIKTPIGANFAAATGSYTVAALYVYGFLNIGGSNLSRVRSAFNKASSR
jgi:hypothetical protein